MGGREEQREGGKEGKKERVGRSMGGWVVKQVGGREG